MEHSEEGLQSPASQRLRELRRARRQAWQQGVPEVEQFERELPEHGMNLEREGIAQELARYAVAAEHSEVAGVSYQPVLQAAATYLSSAGPVRVERHLYRPAGRNTKRICPLELWAGIITGYWTPRAARQGAFVLAQLPAAAAAALFEELGALPPWRSTLDWLPRTLSGHWEVHRPEWEPAVPAQEPVPTAATPLALAVDGVLAPLKAHAAARAAKRAATGKPGSGPTGYREGGCGTLTWDDCAGERRQTGQYAQRPKPTKVTLGQPLQAEAQALLGARPDLQRGYWAAGADTNWQWLAEVEQVLGGTPDRRLESVDFSPACTPLKAGCAAIWGESRHCCKGLCFA